MSAANAHDTDAIAEVSKALSVMSACKVAPHSNTRGKGSVPPSCMCIYKRLCSKQRTSEACSSTHTCTAASLAASSVSNCAMRRLRSLVDVRCCCSSACTARAAGSGCGAAAYQHAAEAMHTGGCEALLQLSRQQVQLTAVKGCCSSPCTASAPV